jgi:hypothetical protein
MTRLIIHRGFKNEHLSKSNFRRHAALLMKNHSLHISYMPRRNFSLTPSQETTSEATMFLGEDPCGLA